MRVSLHNDFQANLKRIITEKRLTQRALAVALGMHEVQVSQMLNGAKVPRLDTVERVAAALDVSPRELLKPVKTFA